MKTGEIITYSQFKMLEYPEHYNYRELYNSSENDTNLNFFKKNEKNSDDLLHKKKTWHIFASQNKQLSVMKKQKKYQEKTENGMTIGEIRHLIGRMTTTRTYDLKQKKSKKKINARNYQEFID